MILRSWILCAVVSLVWLVGCRERQPLAPTTGSYGPLTNAPSAKALPTLPDRSAEKPWTNAALSIIQTELSPATLCHSTSKTLSFFANMSATGIGGPTFAAIETQQGPKIFRPGEVIDPARMRDSWFVVWWAGATNWTNWDSPWFLTLQRRPQKIEFNTNGLHLTFTAEAGYAALMPLYGYYKPLLATEVSSPFALLKEKKKRVLTWEWHLALPADPLARAMYWASALKEFPIYCEDSFSVDNAHDSIVVRQKFRFISWNDDWNTRHVKLAPVSPVLALALRTGFPAKFSQKPDDMEIFTPFGPYYSVDGVDEYSVTLPVLRYVNETEGAGQSASLSNAPCFAAWQTTHSSGDWEALRARWPTMWQEFRRNADGGWAAFGSRRGISPLEESLNALGAARIAYRFGDADAYAQAAQIFARSLIQLCAQQRGVNYFRENQPWHSMEPLPAEAALAQINPLGWSIGKSTGELDMASAPDATRLWRESLPASQSSASTAKKGERLIPGSAKWPFVVGPESFVKEPSPFLAYAITPQTAQFHWPMWKTSMGADWSFGEIAVPEKGALAAETVPLNWNTTVIRYRARP